MDEELKRVVQRAYNMTIIKAVPITHPQEPQKALVYIVNDAVILRIRTIKDIRRVEHQHAFMRFMMSQKSDICAELIADTRGATYLCHEGRILELYGYLTSDPMDDVFTSEKLDLLSYVSVMRLLAQFHEIARGFHAPSGFETYTKTKLLFADVEKICRTIQILEEEERAAMENHISLCHQLGEKLAPSVVHGDIHWKNIIFKNKKAQSLIDFDDIAFDSRYFDLAQTLIWCCFYDRRNRVQACDARFFLFLLNKYMETSRFRVCAHILMAYIAAWFTVSSELTHEVYSPILADFYGNYTRLACIS